VAFLVAERLVKQTDVVPETSSSPDSRPGRDQDAIMQRLVAGDQSALGEVYDEFGRRCYALAYRLIGDGGLAEDAVQEALLALWRAPERFDSSKGSLATFLLTLTHRRSVDVLRRESLQRRGRVSTDDALAELPSGDRGTDEQAEVLLQGAEVRAALNELPPPQREALLLAYFQGYTQREISSITGAPLGTVKTRMLAGVRTMRTRLAGRYPSLGELR
jgi:RNA polymerase sigma factor (sigma-70 family)